MKKIISIILCISLLTTVFSVSASAFAYEPSYGEYDKVFIIGVDGAGSFFEKADTPNFDRIFADGAVKYNTRTETNTMSGQNWAAMLTGVSFFQHKLDNDVTSEAERSSDTKYPSIFTLVRKAMPDAELASFVNWSNINFGIIENDIGVKKDNYPIDENVCNMVCDYLNEGNDPTMMFVHFDSVDHVGHSGYGSETQEYLGQISIVDEYIGRIYDTIVENGLAENALFIVTSDHGHLRQYGGHGGLSMDESTTTIAVKGKTVISGGKLDAISRDRDIAAIVLYALGVERPSYMTSRVPGNLFIGVKGELRPIYRDPLDALTSSLSWIITSISESDLGFSLYASVVKLVTKIANSFS